MLRTIDAIIGSDFLKNSNGKYFLEKSIDADGLLSIALIRDNEDEEATFTKVFDLDVSDIYAQCAPSRIIERLKYDIQESDNMIRTIKADSNEAAPINIDHSATDTPF